MSGGGPHGPGTRPTHGLFDFVNAVVVQECVVSCIISLLQFMQQYDLSRMTFVMRTFTRVSSVCPTIQEPTYLKMKSYTETECMEWESVKWVNTHHRRGAAYRDAHQACPCKRHLQEWSAQDERGCHATPGMGSAPLGLKPVLSCGKL